MSDCYGHCSSQKDCLCYRRSRDPEVVGRSYNLVRTLGKTCFRGSSKEGILAVFSGLMRMRVACRAECDQIVF